MLKHQTLVVKKTLKTKRKRKKKCHPNHTGLKRCKFDYECIDGNMTFYPVAYCEYHKGVLTRGLMKTHKCKERECHRLKEGMDFE